MHVVVNAAMSADGKLSSRRRVQLPISGPMDFDRVAELRASSDAVMVGTGTVLADDPRLTVDDQRADTRARNNQPRQPARIVADSDARTPPDAAIFEATGEVYLLVSKAAPLDRVETLETTGATVITAGSDRVDLIDGLNQLEERGITQLLVEGGGELIYSFFDADLVDDLSVFVGPIIIGGRNAPTLVDGVGFVDTFPKLSLTGVDRIDDGVVLRFSVRDRSPPRT